MICLFNHTARAAVGVAATLGHSVVAKADESQSLRDEIRSSGGALSLRGDVAAWPNPESASAISTPTVFTAESAFQVRFIRDMEQLEIRDENNLAPRSVGYNQVKLLFFI
jgi:hypothetical protein